MDKKCVSSQVILMQVNCFLRKRMVIREGDSKIRVSPNTQIGKSLFILIAFRLCVSWSLPGESAEGAIPQEISAREVLAGLRDFAAGRWSSLSAPPPYIGLSHPTPHLSNHFVAAANTFVLLGHSSFLCPAVALPPWHRWGRAIPSCWLLGCCPHSPQSSQGLQNTSGDFDTGALRVNWDSDGHSLRYPLVNPTR